MTLHDLTAALARIPALATLDAAELKALAHAFVVSHHRPGHTFTREGDRADDLYLVLEGEVSRSREHDDHGAVSDRMTPGELFGASALVHRTRRMETCRADGPATVGVLSGAGFRLLFNTRTHVSRAFQDAIRSQLERDSRTVQPQPTDELAA